MGGYFSNTADTQIVENDRCQKAARQPAKQQSKRNPDQAERQRLQPDHSPELSACSADRFQQAIESNISCD